MDEGQLKDVLAGLPVGPVRYFARIGSTNDEAMGWANAGAPHLALVVADEQTAGRGRAGRRWYTPPGMALAFSLVLNPTRGARDEMGRLTALGALAICEVLRQRYGLPAEIKWPNDVLVERRKLAGVLVEASWQGDQLSAAILGIGVNVDTASVPPESELAFPATSVAHLLGSPVDRLELLRAILEALLRWLPLVNTSSIIKAWEERLAFLGEPVRVILADNTTLEGEVAGLTSQGLLRLRGRSGEMRSIHAGEIHLRPAED